MSDVKRYFEYSNDGEAVLIEVAAVPAGTGPVSIANAVQKTGQSFESVLQQIQKVAEPIQRLVKSGFSDATDVSIEFGIKVSGKSGVIIASSELEGNFKISVSWKKA